MSGNPAMPIPRRTTSQAAAPAIPAKAAFRNETIRITGLAALHLCSPRRRRLISGRHAPDGDYVSRIFIRNRYAVPIDQLASLPSGVDQYESDDRRERQAGGQDSAGRIIETEQKID